LFYHLNALFKAERAAVFVVISLSKIRDRDWSYTRHVICTNNHWCRVIPGNMIHAPRATCSNHINSILCLLLYIFVEISQSLLAWRTLRCVHKRLESTGIKAQTSKQSRHAVKVWLVDWLSQL